MRFACSLAFVVLVILIDKSELNQVYSNSKLNINDRYWANWLVVLIATTLNLSLYFVWAFITSGSYLHHFSLVNVKRAYLFSIDLTPTAEANLMKFSYSESQWH